MPEKTLKGKYLWGTAFVLFLVACGIKWYYVAQQHYCVLIADEPVFQSYHLARTVELKALLQQLFFGFDYSLGSARPFFTNLLYILILKGFGYEPHVIWIVGILVGSLLVPLYFLAVRALVSTEVALASSLMLMWMGNYIFQSVALSTILTGILFIVGALLAAVTYYRKGGTGYLYLSGCLVSMSVFCRYENALLVPAFVGYEFIFDKERRFFHKLLHGFLCAGSSFYILYCNYHLFGDPFHLIRYQDTFSLSARSYGGPIRWAAAMEVLRDFLLRFLGVGPWLAAVIGAIILSVRHKLKALWFFLGAAPLLLYLVYKLKIQTFDPNEKYFFFLPLIALPVGLEFVRVFFAGLGRRRICGVVALGVVAACSVVPFNWVKGMTPDSPLYLSAESIPLIEALKGVPPTEALYIDGGLNWLLTIPTVLIYLKRDPQIYHSSPGNVLTSKTEYYLLTTEFLPSNMPQTEAVKVRDYRACGYDDLALYRITKFKTENEKTLPGPAGEGV